MTAFVYDDCPGSGGRLLEKQFFDSLDDYAADPTEPAEVWSYGYDAFGHQTHVVVSVRDAQTQLLEPARTETNAYNVLGQLMTVTSPEGTIHYEYHPVTGRHTRTYTGDADTDGSMALDGIAITDARYSYDVLGRLDTVTVTERLDQPLATPEVTDYIYDLIGNLDQVRLTNGVIADYDYDSLNRLQLLRHFTDQPGGDTGVYEENVDILLAEYAYDLLPDGRRAGVSEKIWLDDGDGIFDAAELVETRIDWHYDPVGRLTREIYDSHDNDLDFATDYVFDLVGNRREKLTDTPADQDDLSGKFADYRAGEPLDPDQAINYSYDENDRLLTELYETIAADQTRTALHTTWHEYDPDADGEPGTGGAWTMETRKTVFEGADTNEETRVILSDAHYLYNLQNRLSDTVIDTNGDEPGGVLTSHYDYNSAAIRVHKVEGTDQILYLVDGSNPTGYAQILEEIAWQQEAWQRIRAYTLGLDVISQAQSTGEIYHVLYDAHGSTRALLNAAGLIIPNQIFAYDAYGNAHNFDPAAALTTLLYSGEQFDQRLQMQYLRARY